MAFPGFIPHFISPLSLVEVMSEVYGDRPQMKALLRREPALVLWHSEMLQGIEEENRFSLSLFLCLTGRDSAPQSFWHLLATQ